MDAGESLIAKKEAEKLKMTSAKDRRERESAIEKAK